MGKVIGKVCFAVVAWHFNQEYFQALQHLPQVELWVISHKPPAQTPAWLTDWLPAQRILYRPNLGYDWGGYQQFLDTRQHLRYDTIFFTHDDLTLLDPDLVSACQEILDRYQGLCLVGNGRNLGSGNLVRTHPQCYAHAAWKPPSWDFQHDTVRGSFFATTRQALEKIGQFEVYWDRRRLLGVGAGNWSLRASCGRAQHALGEHAFQFLSETYLTSPYLLEMERGAAPAARPQPPLARRLSYRAIVLLARGMMTNYINSAPRARPHWANAMRWIFGWL